MGGEVMRDLTSIALAIVGVAVLAVLVSRNANTSGVVNAASSAYNSALATAMGPVTGYSPGPPAYAGAGSMWGPSLGAAESGAGFSTAGMA